LLGPPGTGKTHLAIALSIRACLAGHRVQFRTATEWVAHLQDAKRRGRLEDELTRLGRSPLLVVDEVGYIPFDPEAAKLVFSRPRRTSSLA
jgi:DNA replication protein DnaC